MEEILLRESVQRLIARILAISPAGEGLCLVGGFRFRLLDDSCRVSFDIDYHFEGDLGMRARAVADLLRRKLLPEAARLWGLQGTVSCDPRPDEPEGICARVLVNLTQVTGPRIDVPIALTHLTLSDPPIVRTIAGTVYLTASDADMVENKVVALFDRAFLQARDLLDLFLHDAALRPDSPARVAAKIARIGLTRATLLRTWQALRENRDVHARALGRIIDEQIDTAAAENLRAAGGGRAVTTAVLTRIAALLGLGDDDRADA